MTDKQTLIDMFNRANLSFVEEKSSITIVSVYQTFAESGVEEKHVHTLIQFDEDGKLQVCRGYCGEDY